MVQRVAAIAPIRTGFDRPLTIIAVAGSAFLSASTSLAAPFNGQPSDTGLSGFFSTNPLCSSATDGCVVCARPDDQISCSTPGIACVQGSWSCTSSAPTPANFPKHDQPHLVKEQPNRIAAWLLEWQTLVTGLLAMGAAWFAIRETRRQIAETGRQFSVDIRERLEEKRSAVRAGTARWLRRLDEMEGRLGIETGFFLSTPSQSLEEAYHRLHAGLGALDDDRLFQFANKDLIDALDAALTVLQHARVQLELARLQIAAAPNVLELQRDVLRKLERLKEALHDNRTEYLSRYDLPADG